MHMRTQIFRVLYYLMVGIFFGIVMTKSEAVSWFRIQEMFHFQSFHMYGIIGTAVGCGALFSYLIRRFKAKDLTGAPIYFERKAPHGKYNLRYLLGGILFGMGWALTGACPGPVFVLLGHGFGVMGVVILAALVGTKVYARFHDRLAA